MKTLPRPRAAPGPGAPLDRRADLVLGRYALLEQIGSGGYGTVWVATDAQTGGRVAVKRIPRGSDDPQEPLRVEREGRAAARLSHPAIVALHESGADAAAHYLVSELVEGHSLAALYRDGGVGDRALLEIGSAIAGGLEHAHERGVVHRDVKPQNVIVPVPGARAGSAAKLTDFGIARLAGEHPLTNTGDVIGTFEYMAPEQAEGRTAGPRADLYSLALTLYEGFAGANPLRGRTVADTALRLGTPITPLRQVRPDLPVELCAAIDRALAPAPGSRGTLSQLRAAIDAALAPRPRRRRLAAGAGARSIVLAPSARVRSLAGASAAGVASGAALSTLFAVHGIGDDVLAGAGAGALVLLSPAVGWLLVGLAAVGWLGASGQPGTALLVCAALLPAPLLLPGRPWLWSLPAIAPLLGVLGIAAGAPAFAGSLGGRAPSRAACGALCYWWLAIAETLSGRRLLYGRAAGVAPRAGWQASLGGAFDHALAPLFSQELLLSAGLWALGALLMPWFVRGSTRGLRALAAIAWAAAVVVAVELLGAHLGVARPPLALLAGVFAAAVALAGATARVHSHQSTNVA